MTTAQAKSGQFEGRLSLYLSKQIAAISAYKSQKDVAREAGYQNPNMLSMFKRGEAKIPLDRIPALAKALNVDAGFMMRMALEDYYRSIAAFINQAVPTPVSNEEFKVIEMMREVESEFNHAGGPFEINDHFKEGLKKFLRQSYEHQVGVS